ncbi:WYL domain-containing protein [Tyzzerella sp. OttesenSCG-928-J15]|nr:WYL domain-containing protein [Tyzzerella sp. OttesenSCG-928-J15]
MKTKKSRILHLLRYLETQTDEAHPATIADMTAHLGSLGIKADRRSVSSDIEQLMEFGVDIVCNTGKRYEYFIGDRAFELPEVKLLVDAVHAARFISPRKSEALIRKLTALVGTHQADELLLHTYMADKSTNEKMYITADLLRTAIAGEKQIRFKYYDYTKDKRRAFKHKGRVYSFSPYGLIWNDDSYYAAGYSESHGKIVTFRVDRIAVPELTDIPAMPRPEGFDMSAYASSVFRMYDGPMREVTLKCKNGLMNNIIDRFGEEVSTEVIDSKHFAARVNVSVSRTFYGWVFSFGGGIHILAPADIAEGYRRMAACTAENPMA